MMVLTISLNTKMVKLLNHYDNKKNMSFLADDNDDVTLKYNKI